MSIGVVLASVVVATTALPRFGKITVRSQPTYRAERIGEVRRGTLQVYQEAISGKARRSSGCANWLRVVPRGYVCSSEVRPVQTEATPMQDEPVQGEQRRYRYAVVHSAFTPYYDAPSESARSVAGLRKGDGVTVIGGIGNYYKTSGKRYLRRSDLTLAEPPPAVGLDLSHHPQEAHYQLGFLVPDPGQLSVPVFVREHAEARLLPRYLHAQVLSERADGRYRIRLLGVGEGVGEGVIERRHLRRVLPAEPPPDVRAGQPWIDISLSQQVALLYKGDDPLYAALISTGKGGATPEGAFAIYRKYRTQTMANLSGASSLYDFRDVPHAQFFHGRIGLHAELWHDQLGHPVSHGCVNLAPKDAARFFRHTEPALPSGWHSVNTPVSELGTRVMVRP